MHKTITKQERRRQDWLRRRGLSTAKSYERKLISLRAKEVHRVLSLCKDYDPSQWAGVVDAALDESPYLSKWHKGLFLAVGIPMAQSTANELGKYKAAPDSDLWAQSLIRYAEQEAGKNIVLVSGTLKADLVGVIGKILEGNPTIGVEKLAKSVFSDYSQIELWQARRIAQTEAMMGMADAANVASMTLGISFLKQWCVSGLANTRESHKAVDGVIVEGNEPFRLQGGLLMYPHDRSLGVAAGEIVNCACACIRRPR